MQCSLLQLVEGVYPTRNHTELDYTHELIELYLLLLLQVQVLWLLE